MNARPRLLGPLVFVSGLVVMATEMTAFRLLAPFFGTSLVITTVVITTMMTCLAVGYSVGGRVADKYPELQKLAQVSAFASLWVIALPFISQPLLRLAYGSMKPLLEGGAIDGVGSTVALVLTALLGTLLLLAIPITLLGMVSPWAIRVQLDDVANAGKEAGRLYALSTFGSILGSALPAIVLLPALGVRNTFISCGTLLLVFSLLAWFGNARAVAGAAAGLLCFIPTGSVRPTNGLVFEAESLYHFIQVANEPWGKCPDAAHLYLNEGVAVHSVKCNDPNIEIGGIWPYVATTPLYHERPDEVKDILIVGIAGGSVARHILERYPDAHIDGVDVDGAVIEAGKKFFDNDRPNIDTFAMDGRAFLRMTDSTYDVIIIDAYRQPYIPFHLVTTEFFSEVKERLNPGGVAAINVASVRGSSTLLLQMVYATMREVFPSVVHLKARKSNDLLAARADSAIDLDKVRRRVRRRPISGIPKTKTYAKSLREEVDGWKGARVLTDDQAPVEQAWELMFLEHIR